MQGHDHDEREAADGVPDGALSQHSFPGHEGRADDGVVLVVGTHLGEQIVQIVRRQIKWLGIGACRTEELGERLRVTAHGTRLTAAASARMATSTP